MAQNVIDVGRLGKDIEESRCDVLVNIEHTDGLDKLTITSSWAFLLTLLAQLRQKLHDMIVLENKACVRVLLDRCKR